MGDKSSTKFELFISGDQLLKGAALNAVQIYNAICNNLYELNIENYFNEFQAERIFDLRELARIVSLETPIKCEYPQQLATLIYSLNAFEKYCRECDNKYLEDAKFHKFLHQTTSQARSLIENALKKVIEMEGIEY